jgi:hypothetical protein
MGVLAVLAAPGGLRGQDGSLGAPIPAAVEAPRFFEAAVRRSTRTDAGSPGPSYWTNWARYDIEASLDPTTALLEGSETIQYLNRSPVSLRVLVVNLYQNLHREGVVRNGEAEITGGVQLKSVVVDGQPLEEGDPVRGPSYSVEGTVMTIRPAAPVEPGDSVGVAIDWSVTLPQNGAGRMGNSGKEMYLVAYWFPKMAVFDDLRGWDAEPYMSQAEFYEDYGDYDAALTVPAGWTLWATGELRNPTDVYTAETLQRLDSARVSDERVAVATPEELRAGRVTTPGDGGTLTYRFHADSVRDFTWTTSNVQRWDASSALVPDRDGDGQDDRVLINAFWREDRAPLWEQAWLFAMQSIEHHSRYTGFSYPWPHMTSVEGADIIDGGMEFPMMTLMGPYLGRDAQNLFSVTSHELAHEWIPMIVGSNERRHAWIDEGSTDYLDLQAEKEHWPGIDHERLEARQYLQVANAGLEQSLMRHGDWYEPGPGYTVASYYKPATLMVTLRRLIGEEKWTEAYRAFIAEWAYKHPTPWDFFNTFERHAGEDLDWFWTSFYYETWNVDFDAVSVDPRPGGGGIVHIANRGEAPFPVTVRITTTNGGTVERSIPLEHWLAGHRSADVELPREVGSITRVEIDPEGATPDVTRANNFWPRG